MKKGILIGVMLAFFVVPSILFGQSLNFLKTQVTTGSVTDETPAWSPNSQKIAFASQRSGNFDIWVVNTNGTGLTQLTSSGLEEKYPSWNPAGTQIAYIVRDPNAGEWGAGYFLYTMNADGSSPTVHPLPPGDDQEPTDIFWDFEIRYTAWSPDGTSIAFVSYGPNGGYNKIYLYNLTNNQVSEITPAGEANPGGMIYKISWCWATNLFAFDRYPIGVQTFTPGSSDLQVLNIPRQNQFDTPTTPGWNPAGTRIAYVKNLYQISAIAIFEPATGTNIVESTPSNLKWPVWSADGTKIAVSDGNIWIATIPSSIKSDFNADGKPDILWRNTSTGQNVVWYMDGVTRTGTAWVDALPYLDWQIVSTPDFNADGKPDILWRNTSTGQNVVWYMDGVTRTGTAWVDALPYLDWQIVGTPDFNADGKPDILWRNTSTGQNVVWYMDGVTRTGTAWVDALPYLDWQIVGTPDFNADGKPDILWRNTSTGQNVVWYMDGVTRTGTAWVDALPYLDWQIVGTPDFNADGKPDILWRNTSTGQNVVWYMDGVTRTGTAWVDALTNLDWKVVGR